MSLSPFAGHPPKSHELSDISALLKAYENEQPDPGNPQHRVQFGTSGHRGSSLHRSFNENHILAMSQAICLYRQKEKVTGPLFLGFDTHALSLPAFRTALEVFAANNVEVMIAKDQGFTPTPVISHAILTFNKHSTENRADGVVITPSHNPPEDGGFKYNPGNGGPAGKDITDWIQNQANEILAADLKGVRRMSFERAIKAHTTHEADFVNAYVRDLANIIDFEIIRDSKVKLAVDPMGGAGVQYWQPIADIHRIDLTVLNTQVDPTFRFMSRDWDGKIRMDPSSAYVMKPLIAQRDRFDVAFACDTDHDRHGIVTKSVGLMPANHYLATSIFYLFQNRPQWRSSLKIGKTLVSSQMIDRVAKMINRQVYEVPVGFKWFVDGLISGELGFVGEESAGASFLRRNGEVWTTDKDGFVPALLAGEMTARLGKDPGTIYKELTDKLGAPFYGRVDSPTSAAEKAGLAKLDAENLPVKQLAGDPIERVLTKAPGNHASIGGLKIETKEGWIAARPSGTEDIMKIYGESFRSEQHLQTLFADAKQIVADAAKLS